MKKYYLLLLVATLCSFCTTTKKEPTPPPSPTPPPAAPAAVNSGFSPTGLLYSNGTIYRGEDAIRQFQKENQLDNKMALSPATKKKITHDTNSYFEVGHYRSMESGENEFAYLIAWKKKEDQWLKELEIIYPSLDKAKVDASQIDAARTEWMNYSNAHKPEKLVEKLYTKNAVYFNAGRVYGGTEEITRKYLYMARPKWTITLKGLEVLPVRDDVVFEVGEYQSTGKGHYVLLWIKESEGPWKALLDFNF